MHQQLQPASASTASARAGESGPAWHRPDWVRDNMAEAPPYSKQRCHRAMSQFGQGRGNVFYLASATRAEHMKRHDQVNNRSHLYLPPGNSIRWVPRQKAAVIWAIRNETITV